jgi:hypothetical protein
MNMNIHPILLDCTFLIEEKEITLIHTLPVDCCVVNHYSLPVYCYVILTLTVDCFVMFPLLLNWM